MQAHDLVAARVFADKALSAITGERRKIGIEEQMFSYLAARTEVSDWLFQTLLAEPEDPEAFWNAVERWKLQVFVDLYRSDPLSQGAGAPAAPLRDYMQKAGKDSVTVDYVLSGDRLLGVVADGERGDIRIARLPVKRTELEADIAKAQRWFNLHDPEARDLIQRDLLTANVRGDLAKLHHDLIEPLDLPATAHRLVIAPDAILFGVPWSALVTQDGGWLASRFMISKIPSVLAVRGVAPEQSSAQRHAVIVAWRSSVDSRTVASALGSSAARGLPGLSGASREAADVANELVGWQVTELTDGQNAPLSLQALQSVTQHAGLIHIAAHGIYNPDRPMSSALFIPRGNGPMFTTAEDLLALHLRAAPVVVLSACQTAAEGRAVAAEPMGLLRAFFAAGASQVIATEWSVDDAATESFFRAFYREWARDGAAARAVQVAQNQVRQHRPHPYYWAGITLNGMQSASPP
jgi:CHAT domain-containing protein